MNAWYFLGADGVRAVTIDEAGANLPPQYGPWEMFKNVVVPEDEGSGTARKALASIGYYIISHRESDYTKGSPDAA